MEEVFVKQSLRIWNTESRKPGSCCSQMVHGKQYICYFIMFTKKKDQTATMYEGTVVVSNKKSKRKIIQNFKEKQELWKRNLLNQGTGHEYQSDSRI